MGDELLRPTRIVGVHIEQVKCLHVVEIRPKRNVVELVGRNEQGKSAVLDSIEYALRGKSVQPPEVIRQGQEYAETVVDLEHFIVRRRWTPSGDRLTLETKDGAKYSSPQKKLDDLIGDLSFDPGAFIRLRPQEQLDQVKKLVGVDTSAFEKEYAEAYALRTKVTAEGVAMKARFEAMPVPGDDVPAELVSVDALLDQQKEMLKQKELNDVERRKVAAAEDAVARASDDEREAQEKVEELMAQLESAKKSLEASTVTRKLRVEQLEKEQKRTAELKDPDLAAHYRKIASVESTNAKVRARFERIDLERALDAKRAEKIALDERVEKAVADKAAAIAKAKFPVVGMSFGAEGLTLDGLPLEQASSARKIQVGLALSIAANPTVRIAFIRDGGLLDDAAMDVIEKMADEHDIQVWIERVLNRGVRPTIGFEIVAGQVVSEDGVPRENEEKTATVLALVPPAPAEKPEPKAETKPDEKPTGPTFKKRLMRDMSGPELAAAVEEVEAAIRKNPLGKGSERARAVLDDLRTEQDRRMADALDTTKTRPGAPPPEPGSDG